MRFRLSLEELKSKVDIALKNDELFADLKDAKIELRLSKAGPTRVSYHGTKRGFWQNIGFWFSLFFPIIYTVIYAVWFLLLWYPYYPLFPSYLMPLQVALFLVGLLIAVDLTLMDPRVKNEKDANTFLLTMPSPSFLYLVPFQMEKSLLHELQHIRQGIRGWALSVKEANRIAKELLPIFLAKILKLNMA